MAVMTIGTLSRRTGVPVKALRDYEGAGLIYTVGRSAGNYRLFDDEALWCVGVIKGLRALGLTVAEIRGFVGTCPDGKEPTGPALAALLQTVRARTHARIVELQRLLDRIGEFEAAHAAELAGDADLRTGDPRDRRA
ncbi:MAG: MerR family transcriptional regulator [Sciscionella sp.]